MTEFVYRRTQKSGRIAYRLAGTAEIAVEQFIAKPHAKTEYKYNPDGHGYLYKKVEYSPAHNLILPR